MGGKARGEEQENMGAKAFKNEERHAAHDEQKHCQNETKTTNHWRSVRGTSTEELAGPFP